MLKKNSDIVIDPKKPFANDALELKPTIELLTGLVQSTSQPFVLSVEAPFGFGKTTFLNLWRRHLELEGHLCLHFNAWENDFVEDPMIAFLGEIDLALEEAGKNEDGFPLAEDWKKVERLGGKLFRKVFPIAVQMGTAGLMKTKDVKELMGPLAERGEELARGAGEFTRKKLEEYESSRKTIIGFREALGELASKLAKKENKKKQIVFFIDELDRCRPDFAVTLLERIKHLFQVEGFFFVLGMDRKQLGCSIPTLYGQGLDVDGYLRRFIDLRYTLPEPKLQKFAELLYDQLQMEELRKKLRTNGEIKSLITLRASELGTHWQMSLRKFQQCFTEMNMVLRTTSELGEDEILPTIFLCLLRSSNREMYDSIVKGTVDPKLVRSAVPQKRHWPGIAEALAILICPVGERQQQLQKDLMQRANTEDNPGRTKDGAGEAMDAFSEFHRAFPVGFRTVVERLELLCTSRPGINR